MKTFTKFDLFGIDFNFHVDNYAKYKTQTGGVIFLIYFFGIITYFIFGITDYFKAENYDTIYYEQSFRGNEINLVNQNFSVAIVDDDGFIRKEAIKLESNYLGPNPYQIKTRECLENSLKDMQEKGVDITKKIICFDNNKNNYI